MLLLLQTADVAFLWVPELSVPRVPASILSSSSQQLNPHGYLANELTNQLTPSKSKLYYDRLSFSQSVLVSSPRCESSGMEDHVLLSQIRDSHRKARQVKSKVKSMLIIFIDIKGIVYNSQGIRPNRPKINQSHILP
jgi:hypothetical protein